MTDRGIGDNNPPEPTEFEKADEEIKTLYLEASNWLDGDAITSQKQANALSDLLNQLRAAKKLADASREKEKKPHLQAGREVDAKYKPLIEKASMAEQAAKKALVPWLEKIEAEKRAEEDRLAAEALAAQQKASEEARAARESADLAQREKAKAAQEAADKLAKETKKAIKDKASASGGAGRAVGLRDNWIATIEDEKEAVRHYWSKSKAEFVELVQKLADRDVRAGKRKIPGIAVKNERKAV